MSIPTDDRNSNGSIPTLDDVARLSGVCKSTASRILGAVDGQRIPFAEKTQEKVRQAALMLGYTPSKLARGLTRTRTGIIGLVVPSIKDSFFPSVTSEIEARLTQKGFSVILANTCGHATQERERILELLSWRVDGLVIAPCQETSDASLYWELWNRKSPFVLIDRIFDHTPFPSVSTDDRLGARMIVSHLIEKGCKRIARAGCSIGISTNRQRHEGYMDALGSHTLALNPAYVVDVSSNLEGGKEAITTLMGGSNPPDAVFCFSDIVAAGALAECVRRGIRVPEDLSIAGYADLEYSSLLSVPLSSVRQPTDQIGAMAAEMLLAQLEGKPEGLAQIKLPVQMIVRASSR
jgi:DNA-binding LacI/PurR family transcriptional regulator